MAKVVTFGELMIRLQPYNYERFVQADHLEFTFGGGEANVAVSLANYGDEAVFVTKLPAHAIGQAAVNSLRRYGVDTTKIVRGGERVGIYFNEKGASQRPSVCIYDRAHSAIQECSPSDFDWDAIFEGVDWFHFTGITPALGENLVTACEEACKAAKARGVKISCDLNYRGKLWTREQARAAMTRLCQYVDVCISNEEDAKDVFGIEAEATDITAGALNKEGYKSVARQLAEKFGFEKVAITLRESKSAFDNDWSAMHWRRRQLRRRPHPRPAGGPHQPAGGGVRGGGFRFEALQRGRLQLRHRGGGGKAGRRRRLRPRAALKNGVPLIKTAPCCGRKPAAGGFLRAHGCNHMIKCI